MVKVAIFGAGKAGKHLYNEIQKSNTEYKVVAMIDNYVDDIIGDIKTEKPEKFFSNNLKHADIAIIAVGAQNALNYMLDILVKNGYTNIYMMHDIAGKMELSLFIKDKDENTIFDKRWIRKIKVSDEKPTFPYIEFPITDKCNLNCKGCLYACNDNVQSFNVSKENVIRDFRRMNDLCCDLPWIRILGGEPLMHPDICEILTECRNIFPDSEIDLCTNGLLLTKCDEKFYEICRDKNISIHVSGYKPTYGLLDKMDNTLRENGIFYTILKRDTFFRYYTTENCHDVNCNYKKCPAAGCTCVYKGKLLRCSAAIAFEKFNEQFNTQYEINKNNDWFDIYNIPVTENELKNVINRPSNICAYCDIANMEVFEWEHGSIKPSIDNYMISSKEES